MKKFLLLTLGFVLVGAGCAPTYVETSARSFDVETAEVGDQVLGMTIVKVEAYSDDSLSALSYDASVHFEGQAEITGEVVFNKNSTRPCLELTEESLAKIPVIEGSYVQDPWVCFSTLDDLSAYGFEKGETFTVVIDELLIGSYYKDSTSNSAVVLDATKIQE